MKTINERRAERGLPPIDLPEQMRSRLTPKDTEEVYERHISACTKKAVEEIYTFIATEPNLAGEYVIPAYSGLYDYIDNLKIVVASGLTEELMEHLKSDGWSIEFVPVDSQFGLPSSRFEAHVKRYQRTEAGW